MMQAQYYDRDGRPASSGTPSSDLMPQSTRSGLRNVVWPHRGKDVRLARRQTAEAGRRGGADTDAYFLVQQPGEDVLRRRTGVPPEMDGEPFPRGADRYAAEEFSGAQGSCGPRRG